jgi:hypothetical protein
MLGCTQNNTANDNCASLKMPSSDKKDANLFLSFFYGMNSKEYSVACDSLAAIQSLMKDSLYRYELYFPDSLNHSLMDSRSCLLTISPSYNDCRLYEITLELVGTVSFAVGTNNEIAVVADENVMRKIEKLYIAKYGIAKKTGRENHYSLSWSVGKKDIEIQSSYTVKMPKNWPRPIPTLKIKYSNTDEAEKVRVEFEKSRRAYDSIKNSKVKKKLNEL